MAKTWAFQCTVDNAQWFQNVVSAAASNVPTARIHFSSAGISWRAVSAMQLVMVTVQIKRDAFAQDIQMEQDAFEVGFNLKDMLRIMRPLQAKVGQRLQLRVDPNKALLEMSNETGGRHACVCLRGLNLESVAPEPPLGAENAIGEFPFEVGVQSETMDKIVKNMEAIESDCMRFTLRVSRGGTRCILGAVSCALQQQDNADVHKVEWESEVKHVNGLVDAGKHSSPVLKCKLLADFTQGRKCCTQMQVMLVNCSLFLLH